MIANLDNAFRYEIVELIEHRLSAFRPILSNLVIATFRSNLERHVAMAGRGNLDPWMHAIFAGRPLTLQGTDRLTAGQVALLGGTRPLRILHTVVLELGVLLDGGDKASQRQATEILEMTSQALRSVVKHHVVEPAKTRDAALRKLGALVDLGIAAQIASTMGALHHDLPHGEDDAGDDVFRHHFLGLVQAFGRLTLTRNDQKVFSDHYIDGVDVERLVDDDGRDFDEEVELRHAFLSRLVKALKAQIKLVASRAAPDPARAELPPARSPKALSRRE